MYTNLRSDEIFCSGPGSRDVYDMSRSERSQIELAVEPVGEDSQVAVCVLAVLHGMKGNAQVGLQLAKHCVGPLKLMQIAGLEIADEHLAMGAQRRPLSRNSRGHRSRPRRATFDLLWVNCQLRIW